jgi:hypothetical protein
MVPDNVFCAIAMVAIAHSIPITAIRFIYQLHLFYYQLLAKIVPHS